MTKFIELPHCDGKDTLYYKTVLTEKTKPNLSGLHLCCWINDIPVYTDSNMKPESVSLGRNTHHQVVRENQKKNTAFLIVGFESERVKTDSLILQAILLIIKNTILEETFPSSAPKHWAGNINGLLT
jgi:hypothetical protein